MATCRYERRAVLVIVWVGLLAAGLSAQLVTNVNTVRESDEMTLGENGDALFTGRIRFPTEAVYSQLKQAFPNPYVLMRNLLGASGAVEVTDAAVSYEDTKRAIELKAKVLGAAVCRRGRWQVKVGKSAEMLFNEKQKCIFVNVQPFGKDAILVSNAVLNLPAGTKSVRFDAGTGILSFALDREPKKGTADLEANLKTKPRVMSALYKLFGNDEFANGIFWTGKTVFSNNGTGDITDLHVSYRMGDFAPWSSEVEYSLVPAGGHVVDLYYPLLRKDVTELKSATPVDLEIKFSYVDSAGKQNSDTISKRITMLGSSQFEYSNLTEEERTSAWADSFSQSPLVAAFVTKMDPPVRQFAGMVAQACGGEPAGASDKAALAFLQTLYDMERLNGIAYQWSASFLIEYAAGQELKYPRDVLRDKSGTCIELAILYAAVCESTGLKSHLMLIPGHCFVIVKLPSGQMVPVECTGISGAAVGEKRSLTFEEAVQFASKEMQQLQMGKFYVVDVEDMQRQGVLCPELPSLPADVLQSWGYRVPQRTTRPPEATSGLSGAYQGSYQTATGLGNQMSIVFAQRGRQLSGEVVFANEATGVCQGIVDGNRTTFACQMTGARGQFTATFVGQIDGDNIAGNWSLPNGGQGVFRLTKAK